MLGEAEIEPRATDGLPDGRDSTRVVELADRFPESDGSVAVVLYAVDEGELDRTALGKLTRTFAQATGSDSELVPSEDGTAALGVVDLDGTGATAVADAVEELRADVAEDLPDGVT